MRKNELELLVRNTMNRVLRGERIEDDFIELKAEWDQDPRRNARQIAALANAAGGQNIVWIVGADDTKTAIKTPPQIEPADWFPQLHKCFDQAWPETVHFLRVPLDNGETVDAAEFETDRAPYVVKTANGGQVSREVPFRKNLKVETATHGDLLGILVPKQKLPDVTILACQFSAAPETTGGYTRGAAADITMLIDTGSATSYVVIAPQMVECIITVGDAVFKEWSEFGIYGPAPVVAITT